MLRSQAKRLLFWLWRLSLFSPLRGWLGRTHFTMVHYHSIPADQFEEHIKFYKQGYNLISLRQLEKFFRDSEMHPLEPNSIVIAFDDGWKANFSLLQSIRSLGCPVTIFLSTGLMGTDKRPGRKFLGDDYVVDPFLVGRISSKGSLNEAVDEKDRTMLSRDEVLKMSSHVDFQSHGVSHVVSTALTNEEFTAELVESKKTIENITGKRVFAFAFPYNVGGEREKVLLRKTGFSLGRVGERRLNSLRCDPYLLNSIGVGDVRTIEELQMKIGLAQIKTLLYHLKIF